MKIFSNQDQEMWVDVIYAVLSQRKFDLKLGDMNYVFRNMIAKFVSSSGQYLISKGVEELVDKHPVFSKIKEPNRPTNLRGLFYGGASESSKLNMPTMFEHSIPAAVIRDELLKARSKFLESGGEKISFRTDVEKILQRSGRVVIILKDENKRLSRSKMPEGWDFFGTDQDNDLARYRAAMPPVLISQKYFPNRDKQICR